MRHTVQCDVGGKTLTIESGWIAGQADGSVTLRLGDTVMLITACMSDKAREGIDTWFTINFTIARDPLEALESVMSPNSLTNYGGYSNEAANDLMARAKAETDPIARAKLVVQVQDIFAEDLPWIPLVQPRVRVFENNRLTGAPKTFVYLNYPWVADLGAP